jgi:hypothetical protein
MATDLKRLVQIAMGPSPWDLGNKVLYDLCAHHPRHSSEDVIIAKLWLIGRSYAAAIERRKNKEDENDNFYINHVAPIVKNSRIDQWLEEISGINHVHSEHVDAILEAHQRVMLLFELISGLEKRSLTSKYLHFHFPNLFYIYDSRACLGIQKLNKIIGRASRNRGVGDNEYRKLFEKCVILQDHIREEYGILMNPRQIDNVLLFANENT